MMALWLLGCAHPTLPTNAAPHAVVPRLRWVGDALLVDDARRLDTATGAVTPLLEGGPGWVSPSGERAAGVRGDSLVTGVVGDAVHAVPLPGSGEVRGWWDEGHLFVDDRPSIPADDPVEAHCALLDVDTGEAVPLPCPDTSFWATFGLDPGPSGRAWWSSGEGDVAVDLVGAAGTASFILYPEGELSVAFDATGAVLSTPCHLEATPHPCQREDGESRLGEPTRRYRWDGGDTVTRLPGDLPAGAVSDASGTRSARWVDGAVCVAGPRRERCFPLPRTW
jgi:hypothetical protein